MQTQIKLLLQSSQGDFGKYFDFFFKFQPLFENGKREVFEILEHLLSQSEPTTYGIVKWKGNTPIFMLTYNDYRLHVDNHVNGVTVTATAAPRRSSGTHPCFKTHIPGFKIYFPNQYHILILSIFYTRLDNSYSSRRNPLWSCTMRKGIIHTNFYLSRILVISSLELSRSPQAKRDMMITFDVFIQRQMTEYYCGSYRIAQSSVHVPVADPGFLGAGFALLIWSPFS